MSTCCESKVRRGHGYCYGVAGNGRECDLALTWPLAVWDGHDPWEWLVSLVIPDMQQRMRDAGLLDPELEVLWGVGGRLFISDSAGAVVGPRRSYAAIGCGSAWAEGALHATGRLRPRTRLKHALEAAAAHSVHVAPPWRMLRVG